MMKRLLVPILLAALVPGAVSCSRQGRVLTVDETTKLVGSLREAAQIELWERGTGRTGIISDPAVVNRILDMLTIEIVKADPVEQPDTGMRFFRGGRPYDRIWVDRATGVWGWGDSPGALGTCDTKLADLF